MCNRHTSKIHRWATGSNGTLCVVFIVLDLKETINYSIQLYHFWQSSDDGGFGQVILKSNQIKITHYFSEM